MTPDSPPASFPPPAPPDASGGGSWGWFGAWALVGALYCLALLGAMTIGIFILPFALVLTIVLARRLGSRVGLGGLVSGAALPFAYVAFLNRSGPGNVCVTALDGSSTSCAEEWSPWPFAATALALAIVGVILFARAERREHLAT